MKNFLRSKTIWGVILVALGTIFPELGLTEESVGELVDSVMTVIGLVLAVIGRFSATTDLTLGPRKCILGFTLATLLTASACGGRKVTTDPTQPPDVSASERFRGAAARAERLAGYAQIAHDALPVFAQAVKLPAERLKRDQQALIKLRDLSRDLAPTLRGIGDATLKDGKERARAVLDEISALLKELEKDGLFIFPETEAGQKLQGVVRTAIALLPVVVDFLRDDLR